jgi:hypothetical protein
MSTRPGSLVLVAPTQESARRQRPCLPTYSRPLPLSHTYVSLRLALWSSHPLSLSSPRFLPALGKGLRGTTVNLHNNPPHLLSLSLPLPRPPPPVPRWTARRPRKTSGSKKRTPRAGAVVLRRRRHQRVSSSDCHYIYYTFRTACITRGALSYTHPMPLVPTMFAHSLQTLPPPRSRVPFRSFTAFIGLRFRNSLASRVPRLRSCVVVPHRAPSCLIMPRRASSCLNPRASPLGRPALQRLKRRRRPGRGTTVRWGC